MSQTSSSAKRGLGRGLGALIVSTEASTNPASPEVVAQADAGGIQLLAVDKISANPHQPRNHFDPEQLAELAASIREHGIIQPLIVTAAQDDADVYWIVAGERRWRAAQLAALAEVPVIIREASPQQLMEWALVENIQRADLNALEEAAAYVALMDEFKLTQADVAMRVGKSRPAIANTVRLLHLPDTLQSAVISGVLWPDTPAPLSLESREQMEKAAEIIQRRTLNVRQTEELVRQMLATQPSKPEEALPDPTLNRQVKHLEDRFRSALGTRVNLARNADGSGRLIVHFYNDEDLQLLFEQMVGEEDM